jgi:cyanate lyase
MLRSGFVEEAWSGGMLAIGERLRLRVEGGCPRCVILTGPLFYRFYKILQVYGLPLKNVIQEKCSDGMMSAIDFTLIVDKLEDPKGDRVQGSLEVRQN